MGICRLVSSLAGGPTFWLSGPISRRIGVNGVMAVTLLAFAVRFLIYATMQVRPYPGPYLGPYLSPYLAPHLRDDAG